MSKPLFFALLATLSGACGPSAREPVAFAEHRFSASSTSGVGAVGSNCEKHGAGDCASGLCLHTRSTPHEGWICSTVCSSGSTCPEGWLCISAHPDEPQRVCVPGKVTRP